MSIGHIANARRIHQALMQGGRAKITIYSHRTRRHVTVLAVVRKRNGNGSWIPRTKHAGRVGLTDGDVIEFRDPTREYPDAYIGRLYINQRTRRLGSFRAAHRTADPARIWCAEYVAKFTFQSIENVNCTVYLADECASCGRELTDPESIRRGIGPECYGKSTGSKVAPHDLPIPRERLFNYTEDEAQVA